ncbi:MAG: MBOAT family protein [Clostridiaceae bacterium]|nr:MBOAT family protein [Clostridiaceae bacterium]
MVFSSVSFLFFFLPVVLLLYYLMPAKTRNMVLLAASLLFYTWGEPAYIVIMIVSCLSGYIHGILIEKKRAGQYAKLLLSSSIIISLGMLLYFKYSDFMIVNINALTGSRLGLLNIALPIGISFYTFQIISYTIDVYRGRFRAQKNLISFATYITFFPQLIAGPIVRYSDIASQLTYRDGYPIRKTTSSSENETMNQYTSKSLAASISEGILRFTFGLAKKVLLANSFGKLVGLLELNSTMSVLTMWLISAAFMLQIYFDFSGYSDMAIGLGRMFGFHFPENFRYPLTAISISDFWRRWHISLGSWFRDYVYIPLGGSRCSKIRLLINIMIVWLLTGLWHGAKWNFVLWGGYFAILLAAEKLIRIDRIKLPKAIKHLRTIFFVLLSFSIFYSSNADEAFFMLKNMLPGSNLKLYDSITIYYLRSYLLPIVIGIIAATPIPAKVINYVRNYNIENSFIRKLNLSIIVDLAAPIYMLTLLVLSTAGIVDGSFNPFIYFRF